MCDGYAAFGITGTMPNPGICRIEFCRNWDQHLDPQLIHFGNVAPCGIIRLASQILEEAKQLIIRPEESSLAFYGGSLRQHLLFQSKIGIEIDLGRLN
jgi:hypothetical protein